MRNPWHPGGEAFPPPPEHPLAERVLAQLRPYQPLLRCWGWKVFEDRLIAFVMFQVDGTTLRLSLGEHEVNADVFCIDAEPTAEQLTWLLQQNLMRRWKARASRRPEVEGALSIYLEAFYPPERLDDLATVLWEGLEESWLWRGQFLRWRRLP